MLNKYEKKYIIILVALLLVSITTLVIAYGKSSSSGKGEPYDIDSTPRTLAILVGDFSHEKKNLKNCDIIEFNSSPDISPEAWNELASAIIKMYNNYDTFIILHNPETITYTASALSFMLENLNKPIVFSSTSAPALSFVKNCNIPEVAICDGERIIRGCRSKKNKNAIISPNYPYLGKIEDDIVKLDSKKILSRPTEPLKLLHVNPEKNVIIFKLFPGVDSKQLLGSIKEKQVSAIVLESYNNGYIPTDPAFVKLLEDLVKSGIVIVNVSQTADNVTNKTFENIGVICGRDITTESALAKLYIILTNVPNINPGMASELMNISMRGEI